MMRLGWEGHTNNLLRKSPTSLVVEGPPMFMNTMAVGPLGDVASCVTGGTTVAIDLFAEWGRILEIVREHDVGGATYWIIDVGQACRERRAIEFRMVVLE